MAIKLLSTKSERWQTFLGTLSEQERREYWPGCMLHAETSVEAHNEWHMRHLKACYGERLAAHFGAPVEIWFVSSSRGRVSA